MLNSENIRTRGKQFLREMERQWTNKAIWELAGASKKFKGSGGKFWDQGMTNNTGGELIDEDTTSKKRGGERKQGFCMQNYGFIPMWYLWIINRMQFNSMVVCMRKW